MNDYDYDYEDDRDYKDDEYYGEDKRVSPKKNIIDIIKEKILKIGDGWDDDYYRDRDRDGGEVKNYRKEDTRPETVEQMPVKKPNNVIGFTRDNIPKRAVAITDPSNVDDASQVANLLIQGSIVTVNLETIEKKDAQRVADFLCGAAFAVNASIKRLSNHIFIITPSGTGVSGGKMNSDGEYDLPKTVSRR